VEGTSRKARHLDKGEQAAGEGRGGSFKDRGCTSLGETAFSAKGNSGAVAKEEEKRAGELCNNYRV